MLQALIEKNDDAPRRLKNITGRRFWLKKASSSGDACSNSVRSCGLDLTCLAADWAKNMGNMMNPYAVIETGGKQYLVQASDTLRVERIKCDVGAKVELRPVLAASNGERLVVGKPNVENAKVTAQVIKHIRGPKLISFKKKRRKGYSRKLGHRQELTVLKVEGIENV